MKYLPLILFLLVVQHSVAQHKIEVFSSVGHSNLKTSNNVYDVPSFNWNAGILYIRPLSKKIKVFSGIKYKPMDVQTRPLHPGNQIDPTQGFLGTTVVHLRHTYLETPLGIRYKFLEDKKSSFDVYTSIGVNLLTDVRRKIEKSNGEKITEHYSDEEADLRNIHFSSNTGVNFYYKLGETLSILIRPNFDYHLTGIYKTGEEQDNFYSFGVGLGISKKI